MKFMKQRNVCVVSLSVSFLFVVLAVLGEMALVGGMKGCTDQCVHAPYYFYIRHHSFEPTERIADSELGAKMKTKFRFQIWRAKIFCDHKRGDRTKPTKFLRENER